MTAAQQVASWAKKARDATAARNEAIAAMRAEGASLRAIAAAATLTPPAIAKILRRAS